MTDVVKDVALDFWSVVGEMSPYLLFGFVIAGILSVLISARHVRRHLGGRGLAPVIKAAAVGVPLPLCSCGVIPVSASLRRQGASKGATTAFLMATPQDGVDSILVTFSLLGPVFAIFRPIVALVSGVVGGGLVARFSGREWSQQASVREEDDASSPASPGGKVVEALKYGFVTLPEDIGRALLVGLVIAAAISALVPGGYFAGYLPPGWGQRAVMMLVGVPVYVCATASVPIAWALITAGVSPGAALVFLMTGPATNAATLSTVWKVMGKRTCVIYLTTVAVSALAAGGLLDLIYTQANIAPTPAAPWMMPEWVKTISAVVLLLVVSAAVLRPLLDKAAGRKAEAPTMKQMELDIHGMRCNQCAQTVREALQACEDVESARVDLHTHRAWVDGASDVEALRRAVRQVGYDVGEVRRQG